MIQEWRRLGSWQITKKNCFKKDQNGRSIDDLIRCTKPTLMVIRSNKHTHHTPLNYESNVCIYAYAQPTPSKIQAN